MAEQAEYHVAQKEGEDGQAYKKRVALILHQIQGTEVQAALLDFIEFEARSWLRRLMLTQDATPEQIREWQIRASQSMSIARFLSGEISRWETFVREKEAAADAALARQQALAQRDVARMGALGPREPVATQSEVF